MITQMGWSPVTRWSLPNLINAADPVVNDFGQSMVASSGHHDKRVCAGKHVTELEERAQKLVEMNWFISKALFTTNADIFHQQKR